MLNEYKALVQAGKILHQAKVNLTKEEGMFVSPAFSMLVRAEEHVRNHTKELFNPDPDTGYLHRR